MRRVSTARNLLEHEYIKPSLDEVELSLDIASLFVLGSKAIFSPFASSFELCLDTSWDAESKQYLKKLEVCIHSEDEDPVHIKFYAIEYFRVTTSSDQRTPKEPIIGLQFRRNILGEYKIFNSDPLFFSLVRLVYAYSIDYKIDEAMENFNDVFNGS